MLGHLLMDIEVSLEDRFTVILCIKLLICLLKSYYFKIIQNMLLYICQMKDKALFKRFDNLPFRAYGTCYFMCDCLFVLSVSGMCKYLDLCLYK